MDLSILIISFNTRELTLACLRSVFDHAVDAEIEVILWDNASSDGSADAVAEAFPQVRLVRCEENLGFGIANNRAAELATGDRLLLLNSDTEVDPGTLDRLLAFAEAHPQAGVIGGRTFFGDRTLNPTSVYGRPSLRAVACKGLGLSVIGRRSKWLNPESLGGWARDTARPVDIITGCFLMMRKPDWDQLGGFDERFFMYGEDWDLCLRAKANGLDGWLCPDATLIHHGGKSDRVRADKMVKLFEANARLFATHWPAGKAWFGVRMLDLWAGTRALGHAALSVVQPKRKESFATWREVWQRRGTWHDAARDPETRHVPTPVATPVATSPAEAPA